MIHNLIAHTMRAFILMALSCILIELKDISHSTHEASITLEKIRMGMR